MVRNYFQILTSSIFNILIIIANSIGIKINIIIEYNYFKFNWKIPQILIIDAKN